VHLAQDSVEALVGVVPESIHVIGEPGQSSGERRREDMDLGRGVDDRADDRRELVDVGDNRVRDEEEPLDPGRGVRRSRGSLLGYGAETTVRLRRRRERFASA
jgi:hypothetical protein